MKDLIQNQGHSNTHHPCVSVDAIVICKVYGGKMRIRFGEGKTQHGPGISIDLGGEEIVTAIFAYLVAHDIYIDGPRTVKINDELCKYGHIYVDPAGFIVKNGEKISGRGGLTTY